MHTHTYQRPVHVELGSGLLVESPFSAVALVGLGGLVDIDCVAAAAAAGIVVVAVVVVTAAVAEGAYETPWPKNLSPLACPQPSNPPLEQVPLQQELAQEIVELRRSSPWLRSSCPWADHLHWD